MTINEVFNFLDFLSNKEQSGGIKPAQFNLIADRAQMEFFNKEFRKYQATREVSDTMLNFLVSVPKMVGTNGKLFYPSDYVHMSSVRKYYAPASGQAVEVLVKEIQNSEVASLQMSKIVTPTQKYPVVSYYDGYMQFLPKSVGTVFLDYIRRPITPIWAFTVVNNRPVYDPANSVDFEFPDYTHNEIVTMMASYLGINLREQDLTQYAEGLKAQNI